MCFLTILKLRGSVDIETIARTLHKLGFEVRTLNHDFEPRIIEARYGNAKMVLHIHKDSRLDIRTSDYGEECIEHFLKIVKTLRKLKLHPKIMYFLSPYIYAYEDKPGKAKLFFRILGFEVEELYSGRCG